MALHPARIAFERCLKEKRRIPELEDVIKTHPYYACAYVVNFTHDRWTEVEDAIKRKSESAFDWHCYIRGVASGRPTGETKWKWLKAGVSENLVDILNEVGMDNNMQAYICKHRPDLIGKIKDLDPSLKAKYQHELELSQVDL
jgi:hypothetical protein